jgi:putative Ca2+/H+ antiporter (TMEM165/GDT1 family)
MSLPPGEASRSLFADRIIAGLSLLIIVSYAPFAIAALLANRLPLVPLGFLVAMVLFSMALGTLLSARLTGTGLIVAPAVGMASIVKDTSPHTINTTQFLLATVFAGLIATWLSIPRREGAPSLRQVFLNNLPRPVQVGVRGGVGALLAAAAIHGVQEVKEIQSGRLYSVAVIMFVISVIVLLISEITQRKLERRASRSNAISLRIAFIVARAAYVLVPLSVLSVLYHMNAFPPPTFVWPILLPDELPILGSAITEADPLAQLLVFLSFTALVLFIFLTDIPGSVYDFFHAAMDDDSDTRQRIDKSFLVTAIMTAVNPVVGLFTSVYYAENYVVVREGEASQTIDHPWTAWFCGLAFLICAAMFLFVQFPVNEIKSPVSEMKTWLLVAVAPALFCVGIMMTARSMRRDFLEELREQNQRTGDARVTIFFFVPVALTVLLTHFVGFELALPIGIIYYGLSMMVSTDDWLKECGTHFVVLLVASCIIALVVGFVRIVSLSPHPLQ